MTGTGSTTTFPPSTSTVPPSVQLLQKSGQITGSQMIQPAAQESENEIITRRKLQELINQISPGTKLENEVEEVNILCG